MLDDMDPCEPVSGSKEVGALAHLYRAEVYRAAVWRERLDQTSSWAVVSTGIGLSIAFATKEASPFPIVLVGLLCSVFLLLEARRYRFFYVWRFRARMLEMLFFVPILRGEGATIVIDRGSPLSDDYEDPQHRISIFRSIARRLRRVYGWIFFILGVSYFAKIAIHPGDVTSWSEYVFRAHIGPLPGWFSLLLGFIFHASWISIALIGWLRDSHDRTKMADFLSPAFKG